jgi:hypothetical protein
VRGPTASGAASVWGSHVRGLRFPPADNSQRPPPPCSTPPLFALQETGREGLMDCALQVRAQPPCPLSVAVPCAVPARGLDLTAPRLIIMRDELAHSPLSCFPYRQDGSSYVCGCCGGVVMVSRRAQHEALWCSGAAGGDGPQDAMAA